MGRKLESENSGSLGEGGDSETKTKISPTTGGNHDFEKQEKSKEIREALGMGATLKMVKTEKEKIEAEVEEVEDANIQEEKQVTDENPFYSSYREAIENEKEEIIQDPLKKERERRQREIEEDEAALRKLESENSGSLGEGGDSETKTKIS